MMLYCSNQICRDTNKIIVTHLYYATLQGNIDYYTGIMGMTVMQTVITEWYIYRLKGIPL